MAQSFNVNIWRYRYRYNSARISGVKYPPNFTDKISITYTKWGGVSPIWSRIAVISLWLSGLLGIVDGTELGANPNILNLYYINKTLFIVIISNSDKNLLFNWHSYFALNINVHYELFKFKSVPIFLLNFNFLKFQLLDLSISLIYNSRTISCI